jgi:hypothetical protein
MGYTFWALGDLDLKKFQVLTTAIVATLFGLALVSASLIPVAYATSGKFQCAVGPLLGANETPPIASTAIGTISFVADTVANVVTFSMAFSGLSSGATAAHIHMGIVGIAGPVKVPLPLGGTAGATSGSITAGTGTPISGFNVADIVATPVGFYVNLHSTTFPGGEIRGQVVACTPIGTVPEFPGLATSALLLSALVLPLIAALKRRTVALR